uniref:Uncharacterized protein n=1 Tax=Lepeophtheirus salmonis TaxID=72036 RepID=A0A0K2UNH8_LEPSM
MDRGGVLMLNPKSSLLDADLTRVYSHFNASSVPVDQEACFKKNEKVGSMAKSMLKHRIQSLTGKNIGTIEKELGIPSPPDGPGLDVSSLRKLAHWLILEANGSLVSSPGKRSLARMDEEDEITFDEAPPTNKRTKKLSRRSCINETLNLSATPNKTASGPKSRRKSMAPEILVNEKVDCRLQGNKPTQAMLDIASKRIGVTNNNSMALSKKSVNEPKPHKPKNSFSGALTLPNGARNEVYIVQSSPFRINLNSLVGEIPSFPGAALSLIHTPDDWMSPEIYLAIESVVNINLSKGLDKFLLLIKCDVDNAASTKASLTARFTDHVQQLFLQCTNPCTDDGSPPHPHKMRETCTTYFLAYFFPGCDKEGSTLRHKMMRNESMTNCFIGKSEEDIENKVIDAFTEPGDWILDLAGKGISEIILSAQKTGRYGIVIDDDERILEDLQEKAVKIANYHDKNFRDVDGDIIHLN